jgi:hypothetical protein
MNVLSNGGDVAQPSLDRKLLHDNVIIVPAVEFAGGLEDSVMTCPVEQEEGNDARRGVGREKGEVREVGVGQRNPQVSRVGIVMENNERNIAHFKGGQREQISGVKVLPNSVIGRP